MTTDDATTNSAELLAWHRLLQVSSRVLREFDRRFDDEHRISLREFDVLINLDIDGGHGLRMTELAGAAMLSSGGLTRLVGRLEDRGYVQREQDPGDARAFHTSLTAAGRAKLAAARVTHDAIVHELFGAHLSAAELASLAQSLAGVLGSDLRTQGFSGLGSPTRLRA